jgi:hypothetical protein
MLKRDSFEFTSAVSELWLIQNICDRSATLTLDDQQVQDTKSKVRKVLENIKRICKFSNLDDAIGPELKRFRTALSSEPFADIARRCDHLRNRILDELAKEFTSKFAIRILNCMVKKRPSAML